jgi:hypothetical protein
MANKRLGVALFSVGTFAIVVHTILPFLWALLSIPMPYPLAAAEGPLAYLSGFTPPIGALLMVIAGLVFGRQERR